MIKTAIEKVEEAKKLALDQIYKNMTDPYSDLEKKIGGVAYSNLPDVKVPEKTMFYARNVNGKDVSTRAHTSFRAKEVMIAGKEYYVTNLLKYPSKKWIKEVMFALKKTNENIEQQKQFEDAISILLFMSENDSMNESFEKLSEAQITEGVKEWLGKFGLSLHKGDGLIDYMTQFTKGAGKLILAAIKGDKEEVKAISQTMDKAKVIDFLLKLDMATMHIVTGPIHMIDAVTGWDLVANLKHAAHGTASVLTDFFKAIEKVTSTIKQVVMGDKQKKLLKSVDQIRNSVPAVSV